MTERETLESIARDMLAWEADQFDAVCLDCQGTGTRWPGTDAEQTCQTCDGTGEDANRDLSVSGADMVDAFADWRLRLKAALA